MRQITTALLQNAGTTIRTAFTEGMKDVANAMPIYWPKIAHEVPSNDLKEIYGQLSGLPQYRKWIGPRVVNRMKAGDYTVFNDKYELTVAISGDDLRFDKLGTKMWMSTQQGVRARQLRDQIVWTAMNAGFTGLCADGKAFFAADHPRTTAAGGNTTWSNYSAGSGVPWFLTASYAGAAPIILQKAMEPNLVERFNPEDPKVFDEDEFVWGSMAYMGAGYFLPSLIHASKDDLDEDGFNDAYDTFAARQLDGDAQQGILPTDLWVPPSLRSAAEAVLAAKTLDGGRDNTNFQKVRINVVPYLTNA